MKTLLFLLSALLNVAACAETLFVKPNGLPLTDQEHAVAYQIMLETQFPMCLVHGKCAEDEIGEMNKKIATQLPGSGITAKFIPTTLYEFIALRMIAENCRYNPHDKNDPTDHLARATGGALQIAEPNSILKKMLAKDPTFPTRYIKQKQFGFGTPLTKSLNEYAREVNTNPELIAWHAKLNTYIPTQLTVANLVINSPPQARESFENSCMTEKFESLNKNIILRAIECDTDAFARKQFVLYRGTTQLDHDIPMHCDRSISFGNTLLNGIIFDTGACPYQYMVGQSRKNQSIIGYALLIDKKEYASGPLSNWFYIPPVTTLVSLTGSGEYFHARSKVVDLASRTGVCISQNKYETVYQICAATRAQAHAICSHILHYIKNNNVVVSKDGKAVA